MGTSGTDTSGSGVVRYRRPDDYYAEMVKTDAHMAKVKGRLIEQVKHVEEGEQRRKQRELKRYAPAFFVAHMWGYIG
jgi:hypothetical protein